MRFATDAFLFSPPFLILGLVLLLLGFPIPGAAFLVLGGLVMLFFRDPHRTVAVDPRSILSPADGKVILIREVDGAVRLSIFLSVFNVHVTRSPVAGPIERIEHRPGKFLLAFDERASVDNEQVIFTVGGVTFSLIAGLVARRIIPWKKIGEVVEQGDRIALIRFGSRADLIIPPGYSIVVREGDRVRAGMSVLAKRGEVG